MSPLRSVSVDDLTRIRWPLDPALSPDGSTLAYIISGPDLETDRLAYQLHLNEIDGWSNHRAVADNARHPVWSPDGESLAYVVEQSGSWQLRTLDVEQSTFTVDGGVEDFSWTSNGDHISVVSRGVDSDSVWLIDAASLQPIEKARIRTRRVHTIACSSDGASAAVVAQGMDELDYELWLIPPDWRDPTLLMRWQGPINQVTWSPNGSTLALTGRPLRSPPWINNELWILDLDDPGTPRRVCPQLDRSIGQLVRGDDERGTSPGRISWTETGQGILAMFADGGRGVLARFDLDDTVHEIAAGDRAIMDFATATRSPRLVVSWTDALTPGELSLVEDGSERRLTEINNKWISEVGLAPTTNLIARADRGVIVEGWLTEPRDREPTPLIVQAHGGPHYPVGHRFSFDSQRLAGLGISLLRFNPRGSQGYGAEHAAALEGDWGGADFEDLSAITDLAASRPSIDGKHIGIIGESYGGYLANWATSQTDRFKAVVAENGVSDLLELGRGPNGPGFWHFEMGGSTTEVPDFYIERSPTSSAEQFDTPLLLIHAEEDNIVPINQSERLFERLTELDKDVTFVTFPVEDHFMNVSGATSSRLARTRILDEFLICHLLGETSDSRHDTLAKKSRVSPTRRSGTSISRRSSQAG